MLRNERIRDSIKMNSGSGGLDYVKSPEQVFYELLNINKDFSLVDFKDHLGAVLFTPGINKNITDILNGKYEWCHTICLDLEDAVPDDRLEEAINNILTTLNKFAETKDTIEWQNESYQSGICKISDMFIDIDGSGNSYYKPIKNKLLIRVREPNHIARIHENLSVEARRLVYGFVAPKVWSTTLLNYIETIYRCNIENTYNKYQLLPILEHEDLVKRETGRLTLESIGAIVRNNKDIIKNIFIGTTDMSGALGLRRNRYSIVYDILIMNDIITNILYEFYSEFSLVAGVWEYYDSTSSILKDTPTMNTSMNRQAVQGLCVETGRDINNGMFAKTIIHPSQQPIVEHMFAPTLEEYEDAMKICDMSILGGVKNGNGKMNEGKPHTLWANKILERALIFGVSTIVDKEIELI